MFSQRQSRGFFIACAMSAVVLASCDRQAPRQESGTQRNGETPAQTPSQAPSQNPNPASPSQSRTPNSPSAAPPQPDNTSRNQRDAGTGTPTPIDQGESESDRRITADIRKAVMARDELSTNAKNCKIITRNGTVTLRGPVGSESEKQWIESRAKEISGVSRVVNELEVTG